MGLKSIAKSIGGAVSGAVSSVGGLLGGGGSAGSGQNAGVLGVGQFKAATPIINKEAFKVKDLSPDLERLKKLEEEQAARSKTTSDASAALLQQLAQRAAGQGPSLAEAQLKSASERNLAQQLAAAQAMRGGSAAARARSLSLAQSTGGRETAQAAAEMRIKETQAAQEQLATLSTNQQQMADNLRLKYLSMGLDLKEADQAAQREYESLLAKSNLAAQGINLQGFEGASTRRADFVSNIGSGLATMFSDKRVKKEIKKKDLGIEDFLAAVSDRVQKTASQKADTDVADFLRDVPSVQSGSQGYKKLGDTLKSKASEKESDDEEMSLADMKRADESKLSEMSDKSSKKDVEKFDPKSFLSALQAYKYKYKNPEMPLRGEGEFVSVMAQDLEKAGPIGKSAVIDTPEGKVVDYGKLAGAMLAAQAHLNKRLDEIEAKGFGKVLKAEKEYRSKMEKMKKK